MVGFLVLTRHFNCILFSANELTVSAEAVVTVTPSSFCSFFQYIKQHRKPVLTFDEALKQVRDEMGLSGS